MNGYQEKKKLITERRGNKPTKYEHDSSVI